MEGDMLAANEDHNVLLGMRNLQTRGDDQQDAAARHAIESSFSTVEYLKSSIPNNAKGNLEQSRQTIKQWTA